MELALGSNSTSIDNHHLVMNKDRRVRYKICAKDFEVDNTSMPDSQNSSIQSRSPRCEAFVMTGDKMLNLNPKISPSYAKVCFYSNSRKFFYRCVTISFHQLLST